MPTKRYAKIRWRSKKTEAKKIFIMIIASPVSQIPKMSALSPKSFILPEPSKSRMSGAVKLLKFK